MAEEQGPQIPFDTEAFMRRVALDRHEPLTPAEKFRLRVILTHPTMTKFLGLALRHLLDGQIAFLGYDLTSPQGVSQAIQHQGALNAYPRFVETLAALLQDDDSSKMAAEAAGGQLA